MEKTIHVGGKEVRMKASALIPRFYRYFFKRDMISDMSRLEKDYKKAVNIPADATEEEIEAAQLSAVDLTIFENIAWLMAWHADSSIPDNPES